MFDSQLQEAGYTASDFRDAGYTADQLSEPFFWKNEDEEGLTPGEAEWEECCAFFSASELKHAGYSLRDLERAGFSEQDLAKAGLLSAGTPTKRQLEATQESKKLVTPEPWSKRNREEADAKPTA